MAIRFLEIVISQFRAFGIYLVGLANKGYGNNSPSQHDVSNAAPPAERRTIILRAYAEAELQKSENANSKSRQNGFSFSTRKRRTMKPSEYVLGPSSCERAIG